MIPVLDKGYVNLRAYTPDPDLLVVDAARVSFDEWSEWRTDLSEEELAKGVKLLKDKDVRLTHFLAKHEHWSPFAHPHFTLEFKIPGMVLDQLIKHRIGFTYSDDEGWQEYQNSADNQKSMRYKEPDDFYVPWIAEWREAPENKKQGSGPGYVNDFSGQILTSSLKATIEDGVSLYKAAIHNGVAPEQARLFIPYYAMYTRRMTTISLQGVIRLCQLREKPDAQYEIREYAKAVRQLVQPLAPESFRAYGFD